MIDYNYPTAFLGEAVQKNLLITDGTVTVSGNTYTVTGDTVTITNSDLETEAFELHQSINSDMQLRFGSCESAYISFVFRKTNITTLIGKTLKVYIIPNHDASKILQLGVFKVQSDKLSYDGLKRNIVAYDAMYDILNSDVTEWYDTILQDEESTCTIEDLRDTFLNQFGLDVEQIGLINDYVTIRRTIDPERLSGADVIRSICEINGVFGMITNEGKFRYVSLSQNIRTLGGGLRYDMPSSQYMEIRNEDYDSKAITAVRIITDNDSCTEVTPEYQQSRNTYTISNNFLISDFKSGELKLLTGRLRVTIGGRYYQPTSLDAIGNPVLEVGDPLCITTKRGEVYTYILQRHMRGIQALRDTYTANGEEYYSDNLNSAQSRYSQLSQQIAQSSASSIVTASNDFVEIIRNIGFRLLDEPSNVSIEYDEDNNEVSLKWTDPADIATNEPCPATWAGTVVVRKEGSAPKHRWDGTLIVDSTTRDEYSVNALVDNTVEEGKGYYYGIFPYDTKGDYRFTKTISTSSGLIYSIKTLYELQLNKVIGDNVIYSTTIPDTSIDGIKDQSFSQFGTYVLPTYSDGEYTFVNSFTTIVIYLFALPEKRITHVSLKMYMNPTEANKRDVLYARVRYIKDGQNLNLGDGTRKAVGSIEPISCPEISTNTWVTVEFDVDSSLKSNYFWFGAWQGTYKIKDVNITYIDE